MIKVERVDDKQFPYEITILAEKKRFTELAFEELLKKMLKVKKEGK